MGGAQSKQGNATPARGEDGEARTDTPPAPVATTIGVASPTAVNRSSSSGSSSTSSKSEHEKDHALVLDLMEYFCYAVKVGFS